MSVDNGKSKPAAVYDSFIMVTLSRYSPRSLHLTLKRADLLSAKHKGVSHLESSFFIHEEIKLS